MIYSFPHHWRAFHHHYLDVNHHALIWSSLRSSTDSTELFLIGYAVLQDANGEDKEYDYEYYDDAIPDSPFVNKFDPTHQTVRN